MNLRKLLRRRSRSSRRERQLAEIVALHQHEAMYFAIPKVACSSLKSVCVDLLGVQMPADAWKPELFYTDKFDHLIDKHEILLRKDDIARYPEYWRFAFVRNPWDRLVSCYAEKIRSDGDAENFVGGVSKVLLPYGVFRAGMSFEEFVHAVVAIPDDDAEPHFHSQHGFLTDRRGTLLVDFIGRFETLDEDFEKVRDRLRVSVELPHLLPSRRLPYREYYDSRLADLVAARYRKDIELFGYSF